MLPICDLHCDLLCYLAQKKGRTPYDAVCRTSVPQLMSGHVVFQTLAIFTETKKGSASKATAQADVFQSLTEEGFEPVKDFLLTTKTNKIQVAAAIENASGLCEEKESLEMAFSRFDRFRKSIGPILYISLTWNTENRFGGGNATKVGLKEDGKSLLDYLDGSEIAIDLSHTSDLLGYDILDYIDQKGLKITPIASHSNFRKVVDHPRNLPDPLAKEIIERGGVIGLNFVSPFIGKDPLAHVLYAKELGALPHLCFGADFFYEEMIPGQLLQTMLPIFHKDYGNASCYPKVLDLMAQELTEKELEGVAYQHFINFIQRTHHDTSRGHRRDKNKSRSL